MRLECWEKLKPRWANAGVEYYPYQVNVAEKVVYEMGGRAVLADEVGLGKTIEAGLVMKELLETGAISTILVLTPASLAIQWDRELQDKFGMRFKRNPEGKDWSKEPFIIASIDLAKREPQSRRLIGRGFDLVVIDEAHILKNHRTMNHRFVASLHPKHLLLLSATPLQNDLLELYNIVSLVRPDLFGTQDQFRRRFLVDKRTPRNANQLKQALSRVLIRNNREQTDLEFPERQVALLPIQLTSEEGELYDELTRALRREYWRTDTNRNLLPLLTLQREVCSSPQALLATLLGLGDSLLTNERIRLIELARSVHETSKVNTLEVLIPTIGEKTIVFTEFIATQQQLAYRLKREGISVTLFNGQMSADQKDAAQREFRHSTQVLVSTECGGQGLNLQFCRNVINYDLPWNPMRVEQRIGRVHRLGQDKKVRIYNLCARETIEEHILRLLDEKINLFREVIGDLDLIIRQLERKRSFEGTLLNIALTSRDEDDLKWRFEELGRQIAGVRSNYHSGEPLAWVGRGSGN